MRFWEFLQSQSHQIKLTKIRLKELKGNLLPKTTWMPLTIGICLFSLSSILVRLAQSETASSIEIAFFRLLIASVIILPYAIISQWHKFLKLTLRQTLISAIAGIALAIHFLSWIASLEHTNVANSTILVTTSPIWVALLSSIFLKERPSRNQIIAIGITTLGIFLVCTEQLVTHVEKTNSLFGNSLALIGAISISFYLLISRTQRHSISLQLHVSLAYCFAAAFLCLFATVSNQTLHPNGLTKEAWFFIFLLAIGPQLIGHTIINWAVRKMTATLVAISILGEPVGAAILAWIIFNETFSTIQCIGFCTLLCGMFFATITDKRSTASFTSSKSPKDSIDK